jgi:hypothetical protein
MNNIEAWQWIATFFAPIVVAAINKPSFSRAVQRWVMIGYSVVAGLGGELVKELTNDGSVNLSLGTILPKIVVIAGATQIWYTTLQQIPATRAGLNKIEVATAKDVTPAVAVAQKQEVNAQAEAVFRKDVA